MMAKEILSLPGSVTPCGAIFPADMPYEQWESIGKNMRLCRESIKFYLGDWLNYGETAYGEKYAQALCGSDYDYDYLRNIAYVCRHVPMSLRSDKLTFGHHQVVAPLLPSMQEAWINTAVDKNMTVRELREAIKLAQREHNPDLEEEGVVISEVGKVCYKAHVIFDVDYRVIVEADSAEEAEKLAIKEAKKMIDDSEVEVATIEVLK
jgi:hypothetical protein